MREVHAIAIYGPVGQSHAAQHVETQACRPQWPTSRACIIAMAIPSIYHMCTVVRYTLVVHMPESGFSMSQCPSASQEEVAADHGLDIDLLSARSQRHNARHALRCIMLRPPQYPHSHHPAPALSLCVPAQAGRQVLEKKRPCSSEPPAPWLKQQAAGLMAAHCS